MSDTVITIIAIFVVATLMLVYPLLAVSERNEDVTQLAVQTKVSEFVSQIATVGAIKESEYDKFVQELAATGNTYEIEIEVQHLDENPGKKSTTGGSDAIGENVRYSTFTSSIIETMGLSTSKSYTLKKGDIVIMSVKNTNTTIAQMLRKFFYSVTGQGTYQIGASASSMVVNNGQ